MAIKTVSLEVDAYDILSRARKHPRESFSSVVRRGTWEKSLYTGTALAGYTRERMRRRTTMSEASLQMLKQAEHRVTAPHHIESTKVTSADSYILDGTSLVELEFEVASGVDGPVVLFLASKPSAVFGVSMITAGAFSAPLSDADTALGSQVLAQFELANLSPLIAERYARETARAEREHNSEPPRVSSNDMWIGCTAATLNSPLLTRRAERFAGIEGLQLIVF